MPARLSVFYPHRAVRKRLLGDAESCLIGRAADCDLPLDDTRVSRHHARLEPHGGSWRLSDLESKNGTFVDGLPAGDRPLPDAAWLSIGGLPLCFEWLSEQQRLSDFERDRERWQSSLALQRKIDPAAGLAELLDELLASVLEVTEAERAGVLLADPDGSVSLTAAAGPSADELGALAPGGVGGDGRRAGAGASRFRGSRGAVEQALAAGRPVVVSDTWDDDGVGGRPSVVAGRIRSLVSLPLTVLDRTLGVVYADSTRPGSGFGELDVEILEALASHTSLALGVARLHDELAGVRDEIPTRLGAGADDAAAEPAGLGAVWERAFPTYRGDD